MFRAPAERDLFCCSCFLTRVIFFCLFLAIFVFLYKELCSTPGPLGISVPVLITKVVQDSNLILNQPATESAQEHHLLCRGKTP